MSFTVRVLVLCPARITAYEVIILAANHDTGQPAKWISNRTAIFLSDHKIEFWTHTGVWIMPRQGT